MAGPPPLGELPPGYASPDGSAAPQILAGSLKAPLWLRASFQGLLFSLGCAVQRHCGKVLFLGLLAFGALALGLRVAVIETDLEQLWVEAGSRVSQELQYTKEKLGEEAAYTSQMLIQTPRQEGENVLTPEALGLHLQAALTASKVQVSLYGKSWDLNKICYKSGVPLIENGMIERMIEKLFPCVILTPLDCFWEGAKLQGGSAYLPGRPDIQWTNLDPEHLLEELGPFASLEGFRELLDKAQVGQAYVGRPCLHPDDLHCPPSAPNHHSRQAPNVAQELSGGCHGFSHKFMHWQEELLLGGMARDPQGQLLRAEALQSTFLLMSPRQLYEHFRGDYQTHDIGWSEEQAGTVLQAWQRRFVQLAQEALPENASQQIHAFSAATLDDILHAFSEVSATRVVGGYLLMVRQDCRANLGANRPGHSAAPLLSCPPLCRCRCCPSWHWESAWMTYSCWHMPSQRPRLALLSRCPSLPLTLPCPGRSAQVSVCSARAPASRSRPSATWWPSSRPPSCPSLPCGPSPCRRP
ncbi:protein patched homolog 2 isoform X13 [Phacochoerus africanus]|uniref:protein patched homolog 2 isoform X13 n=1 Tax=Phacochoerus africanus TaxID=41426 RepID=UPI001FD9DED6|nr:protein patched homolog 2 isoform X13 [Phacochoerus africanus]